MTKFQLPSKLKIAFCGGGSGGHLFPALAVLEQLRERCPEVEAIFITAGKKIEHEILSLLQVQQFTLKSVTSNDLKRSPVSSLHTFWKSWAEAKSILASFLPHIVLGCGGYASVPGIVAARQLKLPRVLLEQNVMPGRATTFLSRIACGVCVSFSESIDSLPNPACGVWTGNPLKKEIVNLRCLTRDAGSFKKHLLVIGGSQGATSINAAMCEILRLQPQLFDGWTITHQAGAQEVEQVRNCYQAAKANAHVTQFIDNMSDSYANADIVISRAGATSLAEIACAGLATILVPYPNSFRNHQLLNANWYADRQAAIVVEQTRSDFTKELLMQLQKLIHNHDFRISLQHSIRTLSIPKAASNVVNVIESRLLNVQST